MKSEKRKTLPLLAALLAAGVFWVLALNALAQPALAQSGDEAWSEPHNLSRSGGATSPKIIIDSANRVHIVWSDEFEGLIYSMGSGGEWTEPRQVAFPFTVLLNNLKLKRGPGGVIHAVWRDATTGALNYSNVGEGSFSQPSAWTVPVLLATANVGEFNLAVGPDGDLHVLMAKVEDDIGGAAGIYYRSAEAPFFSLNAPSRLLFDSLYFRGLAAADLLLDISAGSDGQLYAGWDLKPLEQVFYTRSLDGGRDWEPIDVVDNRLEDDSFDAIGPRWLQILAKDNNVVRLWQAGHDEGVCSQYFQFSADGGETWSERALMADSLQGCPTGNQLLLGPNGEVVVMSVRPIGIFLQAWDGSKWSTPQLQTPLTNFTNPDTFRQVELGCRQGAFDDENQLYVVGCDTGGGRDIWVLSRPIGQLEDWYPTPTPTLPRTSPNQIVANKLALSNPVLVSDAGGKLHAFWNQQDENAIFYARWEGDAQGSGLAWSNISIVVNAPGGKAQKPDALVDGGGRLMLVWGGGASGGIGFSHVDSAVSIFVDEWATPVLLPAPRSGGASPRILTDANGTIYVIYAITVNEARGIYMTRSDDRGVSWSQPFTVFDAEGANWDMIDRPSIAVTADGRLHALWSKFLLEPGGAPIPEELYYASSSDGGQTWSAAEAVSTRSVFSSQVVVLPDGALLRVWSDQSGDRLTLWYQVSFDGGANWSDTSRVSEYGNETKLFRVEIDPAGIAHLVQIRQGIITETGVSPFVLQHLVWNGTGWNLIENLELGSLELTGMNSAASSLGYLGVVFVRQIVSSNNAQVLENLLFVNRPLDFDVIVATPMPTFTPQPGSGEQASPTTIPSPTPTIEFSTDTNGGGPLEGLGEYGGLLIGLIPAALVVVLVFSLGKRRRR